FQSLELGNSPIFKEDLPLFNHPGYIQENISYNTIVLGHMRKKTRDTLIMTSNDRQNDIETD
ncbi:MAG: hypothetical protein HC831_06115, partial [Chloroflexia bacterium]|nr:hypothetical protein [Chloroflexia bacterium]